MSVPKVDAETVLPAMSWEYGRPRFDLARSEVTKNTVKHILEILSPQQRAKWDEPIGEPFEG